MSKKIDYTLSEIQKNADSVDAEELHLYLLDKVEKGEYDSFFDAFVSYAQEYDIDLNNPQEIKKYITPTLKGILYREAQQRSLLKDERINVTVEDFF